MQQSSLTAEKQEKVIEILRSNGVFIGYLFGSYSRGRAGNLSDIDLGVVFPKSIPLALQEQNIEQVRNSLEKIFGKDKVDIVNVPQLRNPLLRYVITLGEGKILFAEDISQKNNLADQARREFEDTRRLREIQSQALKNLF